MPSIDISPFALPNSAVGEVRFEDPRDIDRVVVTFAGPAPESVTLSYLQKTWPEHRLEQIDPAFGSMGLGWFPIDDQFNSTWKEAATNVKKISDHTLEITFKGLTADFPEIAYDVTFRRTLGVKIDAPAPAGKIEVYTTSEATTSEIRLELDAGKPASARHPELDSGSTPGGKITLSAYNAIIEGVTAENGVAVTGNEVRFEGKGPRVFRMRLSHLKPAQFFSFDEGLVTFALGHDAFTVSLDALRKQGPVWYEEEGVYVRPVADMTTFEQYRERYRDKKTTARMVEEHEEQSLGGAMKGQPRPHAVAGSVGCKHCRQRFWIEPNGDVVLHQSNLTRIPGRDTERFKNEGNGRLFFGFERWSVAGRALEPGPVLVHNTNLMRDDVLLEQQAFAVPLDKSIFDDLAGDDNIICITRFRFRNTGDRPVTIEAPITYSDKSGRSWERLSSEGSRKNQSGRLVPLSPREKLEVCELGQVDASGTALRGVRGEWQGQSVLRCAFAGDAQATNRGDAIVLSAELAPGEKRDIIVKAPYIGLDQPEEIRALAGLDFKKCRDDVRKFWREECRNGAQLKSPEPDLDILHRGHLAFVEITDSRMPDDPDLVNTSVGTSTYGNFTNESCMIIEELDGRGLHDQARQRLDVWLKYQGTQGLNGMFTDHDGLFYGAGGYESGHSYCQHHGWAMWRLSKHYLMTGDKEWFAGAVDKLLKGVDWVIRQRRETMKDLPHSRGWERGWLAPGGLEDVSDYFFWLSTNNMTFRGVEYVARALEAAGHPEAARVRAEADDYRDALKRGFETARRHGPLVRLNDGRWVPHYPSRLYRRGRDVGWIREILEGAIYMLISELYDPNSREAGWILDDYLDNRYMSPNLGYPVYQPPANWFDYGGFSQQPCLLAGLMPYLDRDEPEVYIWMFFNAWASCFREEVSGMIEHPAPILGYSNCTAYKTSDEANAVMWFRYMYVYAIGDVLHLGRAIPREWLSDNGEIFAEKVATRFGQVSVRYNSEAAAGKIAAQVDFVERNRPGKLLVRFRHPERLPVESVTVNGQAHAAFDAVKGDVDITGKSGRLEIVASYKA